MKPKINGETGIMGIIGGNIRKSFSPFLHNKLLQHYSMNERYLPFQISLNLFLAAILSIFLDLSLQNIEFKNFFSDSKAPSS